MDGERWEKRMNLKMEETNRLKDSGREGALNKLDKEAVHQGLEGEENGLKKKRKVEKNKCGNHCILIFLTIGDVNGYIPFFHEGNLVDPG